MIILKRPLVFFDLEATGVSPAQDRIIDIALVKHMPDQTEETFISLVDPDMPIPPEATAVHHITDVMVQGQPKFHQIAPRLLDFIGDADLGGFGVLRFDIPMLAAEFKRAGITWRGEGRSVVDALTIFHRREPRNLSSAYRLYCGKDLPDAHRAEPDARAASAVFWAQLEHYSDLPRDIIALSDYCSTRDPNQVDAEGKFVWRNGHAAFNFGKHRTLTLEEVAKKEPSYLEWLMRTDKTTPELAQLCRDALNGKFPIKRDPP